MKKISLIFIGFLIGIIISGSIYFYYIKTNIDELDINDCKIQYSTYDYKVEYSDSGYTLNPQTFGLQYLFINYFQTYGMNRQEFVEKEILKKGYTLFKSIIENELEIYKGYHHSDNNFTKDTINYYIVGKSFYLAYLKDYKHSKSIIESCANTWKKEITSKKLSEHVLKSVQDKLGLTREEAIEHFRLFLIDIRYFLKKSNLVTLFI